MKLSLLSKYPRFCATTTLLIAIVLVGPILLIYGFLQQPQSSNSLYSHISHHSDKSKNRTPTVAAFSIDRELSDYFVKAKAAPSENLPILTDLSWRLVAHPEAVSAFADRASTCVDFSHESINSCESLVILLGEIDAKMAEKAAISIVQRVKALNHDRALLKKSCQVLADYAVTNQAVNTLIGIGSPCRHALADAQLLISINSLAPTGYKLAAD